MGRAIHVRPIAEGIQQERVNPDRTCPLHVGRVEIADVERVLRTTLTLYPNPNPNPTPLYPNLTLTYTLTLT